MTTTAFRNVRALISLFSLLLIVINIPLPILLIKHYTIISIESDSLAMGYLSILSMYKIVIIFNITLGMFASCGVNSKVRMYMKVYLFITFFYLFLFLACILYVKNHYLQKLLEKFNMKAGSNVSIRCLIETDLDCNMATKTCHTAMAAATNDLIRYFVLISTASLILHLLNFIFIKVATNIRIEKPEIKLPKIVTITKAGMNTQSLRQKRVLDVNANGLTPTPVAN